MSNGRVSQADTNKSKNTRNNPMTNIRGLWVSLIGTIDAILLNPQSSIKHNVNIGIR